LTRKNVWHFSRLGWLQSSTRLPSFATGSFSLARPRATLRFWPKWLSKQRDRTQVVAVEPLHRPSDQSLSSTGNALIGGEQRSLNTRSKCHRWQPYKWMRLHSMTSFPHSTRSCCVQPRPLRYATYPRYMSGSWLSVATLLSCSTQRAPGIMINRHNWALSRS